MGGGTGGFWPSLLATAVVALAFQPLRRRVVRVADRLAFGAAAAPYEALADFSRRLGDSPDPSDLLPAVAEAAARAVGAGRVIVRAARRGRARPDGGLAAVRRRRPDGLRQLEMPVVDRGERLGSITVEMPAGHPLRLREQRLLADLADQAGLAFRNARLTAELSGQVEQLGRRTRELTESRRRLISAGDAERSRLEQAIARQVVAAPRTAPGPTARTCPTRPPTPRPLWTPHCSRRWSSPRTPRWRRCARSPAACSRPSSPAPGSRRRSARCSPGPRSSGRLVVDDSAVGRRFDPRVEAAAYFCVAEAVRDLGGPGVVVLDAHDERLRLVVSGGDRGGLPLGHMRDRVEAAGGSVSITARTGTPSSRCARRRRWRRPEPRPARRTVAVSRPRRPTPPREGPARTPPWSTYAAAPDSATNCSPASSS